MKNHRLYEYVSKHDAEILEELYIKCEKLFKSLISLETDLAKRIAWREYHNAIHSMINWLMEEI